MASTTFADVQNIRLSGDVRLRGYELINAGDNHTDENFITQRTRVTVEADLEDHVLVVATLKAEGLWGALNDVHTSVGAGSDGYQGQINRAWDVGLVEAYVQMNEAFYTPATLKLGRQFLNYGHGLIISSVEQEYNFDAARLVLDYYPLTIDAVYARAVQGNRWNAFGAPFDAAHNLDVVFLNGRYEMTDSIIKNVEAYFGYQIASGAGGYASPVILGLRSDMNLTEGLNTWIEGAYELGSSSGGSSDISAWLLNIGARYTLKNMQWSPVVNANYIYASGGTSGSGHNFVPWADYVDGYNGMLFAPELSNIHIINLGASVKPCENATLSLQGYYYLKADKDGFTGSNSNVDFGGIGATGFPGGGKDMGIEVDAIVGYDYSKDVRAQLVYGVFIPGHGLHTTTSFDAVAQEIRGELNVKF